MVRKQGVTCQIMALSSWNLLGTFLNRTRLGYLVQSYDVTGQGSLVYVDLGNCWHRDRNVALWDVGPALGQRRRRWPNAVPSPRGAKLRSPWDCASTAGPPLSRTILGGGGVGMCLFCFGDRPKSLLLNTFSGVLCVSQCVWHWYSFIENGFSSMWSMDRARGATRGCGPDLNIMWF